MVGIAQAMRDIGFVSAVIPEKDQVAITAAGRTLDSSGNINQKMTKPFRTPIAMNWLATSGERIRSPRAGKGILVGAHAATPPSSGQLIIRLYNETQTAGQTLVFVLYHPQGSRMYEEKVDLPVLAGSWWSCDVQSSGSAAGVSVAFSIDVG